MENVSQLELSANIARALLRQSKPAGLRSGDVVYSEPSLV